MGEVGSRWKPLPSSLPSPARELAERMRASLDSTGWSLRRLAADDEVHFSLTAMHRFFSGQAQPPRALVDMLVRKCGDDPAQLLELYERARAAVAEPEPATTDNGAAERDHLAGGRAGSRRRPLPSRRDRPIAVGAVFAAGLVAGVAIALSITAILMCAAH